MKTILVICTALMFPTLSHAKHDHPEEYYQEKWCIENNGQTEVILYDKTRCDCLTLAQAIEFDFGPKWAESIGQALYYSIQTGKRAGVVIIMEQETDLKYWIRLNTIIDHNNLQIDTWKIGNDLILLDKELDKKP